MKRHLGRRSLVSLVAAAPLMVRSVAQDATAANEALVRRFYAEVLAWDGDLAVVDDLLAADFVPQDPADVPGRDAYKQRLVDQRAELATLFREWRYVIDDLMATGDRVAVRTTIDGVGRFSPKGSARVMAFGWFVIADDQITRFWSLAESLI